MKAKEFYKKHKKSIQIALLIILSIVFIISLYNQIFNREQPPLPGSINMVMCFKCGIKEERRVVSFLDDDIRCKKCGNEMGKLYKCLDCSKDFPELKNIRSTTVKYKNLADLMRTHVTNCTNCKSINTYPVPPKPPGN